MPDTIFDLLADSVPADGRLLGEEEGNEPEDEEGRSCDESEDIGKADDERTDGMLRMLE